MRIKKYFLPVLTAVMVLASAYPAQADDENKINYTEILPPGSSFDMSKDSTSTATAESWGVSGNTSQQTVITSNGILLIGADEKSETITVSETSMDSPSSTTLYYIEVDPSADIEQVSNAGKILEAGHYYEEKDQKNETKKETTDLSSLKNASSAAETYLNSATVSGATKDSIKKAKKEADVLLKDNSVTQRQLDVSYQKLDAINAKAQAEVDASQPIYERYQKELIGGVCLLVVIVGSILIAIRALKKQGVIKQKTRDEKPRINTSRKTLPGKSRSKGRRAEADDSEDSSVELSRKSQSRHKKQKQEVVPKHRREERRDEREEERYREDPSFNDDDQETSLLTQEDEGGEETTVLDTHVRCWLVSAADRKETEVTGNPFIIGKERAKVDFCISKNVVSRRHAKLTEMDGSYYLTDLNSSNGTFIDGEQIPSGKMVYLKNGTKIRFADQEYIFKIEQQ